MTFKKTHILSLTEEEFNELSTQVIKSLPTEAGKGLYKAVVADIYNLSSFSHFTASLSDEAFVNLFKPMQLRWLLMLQKQSKIENEEFAKDMISKALTSFSGFIQGIRLLKDGSNLTLKEAREKLVDILAETLSERLQIDKKEIIGKLPTIRLWYQYHRSDNMYDVGLKGVLDTYKKCYPLVDPEKDLNMYMLAIDEYIKTT